LGWWPKGLLALFLFGGVLESAPEATMECNRIWVAIIALGLILFAALPVRPSELRAAVSSRNLSALEKTFANYSKDFRALEKDQQGVEFWEIEFLDGVAATAEDRLHAASAMLEMYRIISCGPDREKATPILKDQLAYYAWQMGNESDRSAGSLQFTKMPAVAQMGLKMKDDLRAAQSQLEEIGASLK
jgi:hypothetical protein